MNTAKISDWLQVAGMFGVIGSLVFVGLQMKQAQEIALSSIYQARSDASVAMSMASTNSPEVLSALAKAHSGRLDQLSMREAIAFEHYVGASVTMIESNHRQFEAGFLPEEHWQRNLRELKCILVAPERKEIIMSWQFSDSFMDVVRQLIGEQQPGSEECWIVSWSFVKPE